MDTQEYGRQKESLIDELLEALSLLFSQFIRPKVSQPDWYRFTSAAYQQVIPYREEATDLAREFYDANRALQTGDPTRNNFYKDDYYPLEWFQEALEPVYDSLQNMELSDDRNGQLVEVAHRTAKVVEDAGRRTTFEGIRSEGRPVRWARFDPRPPTCAFCTMLISRGPVYLSAASAGGDMDDIEARQYWRDQDTDRMNAEMIHWHPGCTCIVVPVYDMQNYPTRVQEDAAFEIYKKARRKAQDNSFKAILNEMRKLLDTKHEDDDETELPR